jgi:hypothetical protein
MFRSTWPSSIVLILHIFIFICLKDSASRFFWFAVLFLFHVVICFPSLGWVKYEVLLFAIYAIFGTSMVTAFRATETHLPLSADE